MALSGPEIFFWAEDSMFSLKGRVSYDIPMRSIPRTESRVIFHPFRSPRDGSGRRRPLHKITLLLVRPLRWPRVSLFRGHFLPRHMSRRAWSSLRGATAPYFVFYNFFLSPLFRVESSRSLLLNLILSMYYFLNSSRGKNV